MTFLITFALAVLGVVLAGGVLRIALARGERAPSWGRALALGVVAILVATGLVQAGDSYRKLRDRRAHYAPLPERDALEINSAGVGIDPSFTQFAKDRLLRGETFYLPRSTKNETKVWLAYRLAPNLMEDRPLEADWIIYHQNANALRDLAIAPKDIDRHEQWSPDTGMVKVRRED